MKHSLVPIKFTSTVYEDVSGLFNVVTRVRVPGDPQIQEEITPIPLDWQQAVNRCNSHMKFVHRDIHEMDRVVDAYIEPHGIHAPWSKETLGAYKRVMGLTRQAALEAELKRTDEMSFQAIIDGTHPQAVFDFYA